MRITDPIRQIDLKNVQGVWEYFRDEVANHAPVLSMNLAGEIAAVRIINAYAGAVIRCRKELDRMVKDGGPITDEQDQLYGELPERLGRLTRSLELMSGIRAWQHVGEHPLASRPLDAEPLEDNLARRRAEHEEAKKRLVK